MTPTKDQQAQEYAEKRLQGRDGEDIDRLNEAFGKIKALAKSLPHPRRKSYESPYAKFDRIKKKR